MSAIRQVRARDIEARATADPDVTAATPASGSDNPIQLLREAIARLNSSHGELPDQAQLANLLAEAREALERANVVNRAVTQCEEFLRETQFDKAFEALDAGLSAYPDDPALVARRREVERHQKAFQSGVAARTALEEAQWLLDQDRPDLAAQFLKQKTAELPDQTAVALRLEQLEALLPQWEQNRQVQAALARVASLQQIQQWQVALTILDEALRSYPASEELTAAAQSLRDQLLDQERQKKLARRLELIGQKLAEQSWRQALTLLENTQSEFPGAPELNSLRREAQAGLKRSECDAIVADVRQSLADGEPAQAEQILRKGLELLGPEPALESLRGELESEKEYREDLRAAQVLFGRRQLQEAERILIRLVAADRPDAQALLDAVRSARAATEEENFCERGREKALKLMQQQQYAQAADLLRNLLLLFPGNPILERDLAAAQAGVGEAAPLVIPAATPDVAEPPAPVRAERAAAPINPASRMRRAAIVGTAGLVLVSGGAAAWRLSRNPAPVPAPAATRIPSPIVLPAPTQSAAQPVAAPPDATPKSSSNPPEPEPRETASAARKAPPSTQPATPLRAFVPPVTKRGQPQASSLSLPADTVAIVTPQSIPGLPAELARPLNAPAPPPAAPPAAAAPPPASKPALSPGGRFVEPQPIERPLPAYPQLARQRGVFGVVKMEAAIDERGNVTSVKIVSGDVILAATARNAVLKWKYKPATLNGQPIATSMNVQVLFGDRK